MRQAQLSTRSRSSLLPSRFKPDLRLQFRLAAAEIFATDLDEIAPLLGIGLRGNARRTDEIAEHHREAAALACGFSWQATGAVALAVALAPGWQVNLRLTRALRLKACYSMALFRSLNLQTR